MAVIIIESPNKIKKVKAYSGMEVFATVGHFMELKNIDINKGFSPTFDYLQDKKKNIFYYIERCKNQEVYIATDPDREGYAIGKMFFDKVKNVAKAVYRAEFHEITESGIKKGLKEAVLFQNTNFEYYNSFLARRVGDRLIGYSLSPYLSKELSQKALSAGRVQTPTLGLIVQREREIQAYEAMRDEDKITYCVQAKLKDPSIVIKHIDDERKEVKFDDLQSANEVLKSIEGNQTALITEIKTSQTKKSPPKPFITSTLLKAGSKKLGLSTQAIQQLAQSLFEAGLITYIRTDAEFLSQEFLQEAQAFYSPIYPQYQRREYTSKNSQAEAHEAIRITHCHRFEEMQNILAKENITDPNARALYELIFKNTICSQAKDSIYEKKEIFLKIRMTDFKCVSTRLLDGGFMGIFGEKQEEEKAEEGAIQLDLPFEEGQLAALESIYIANIKKEAPKRYKEADFISVLEKRGIGRPSTYSTYLPLLCNREYIQISNDKTRTITPTSKGISVVDFFKKDSNAWILDVEFTKEMEEKLDLIVKGEFKYLAFMQELEQKIPCMSGYLSDTPKERKIYPPSQKQIEFAQKIANDLSIALPDGYQEDLNICKEFIDKNLKTLNSKTLQNKAPTSKQIAFAEKLAQEKNLELPKDYKDSLETCKNFIDKAMKQK